MSLVIHIVTQEYPPVAGGLELWTQDLAAHLCEVMRSVTVYVTGDQLETAASMARFEVVPLAKRRTPWEAPLREANWPEGRRANERSRLDFLLLRQAIVDRVANQPDARHVIFSNFTVSVGQLAMLVADDLNLPHVAAVVGTDFSRGFRNFREHHLVRNVCQSARLVVCKSTEQARKLSALTSTPVRIIPTSVEVEEQLHSAAPGRCEIGLIADCGLSYHKGSSVLLDVFLSLLETDMPVTLTMFGSVAAQQESYWHARLDEVRRRAGAAFSYMGHVPREQLYAQILRASIYCSATLGEGSSAARIHALCAGIPIVTTRCGEFAGDVPEPASHVRLARLADSEDFARQLATLVHDLRAGRVRVDRALVATWRDRFAPAREWAAWTDCFEYATGSQP